MLLFSAGMSIRTLWHSFGGAFFIGAALLVTSGVEAQNLFLADYNGGNIYEYAPDGTRSTFATGLVKPVGLVFNREGDLFVIAQLDNTNFNDTIYEYSPDGTQVDFASGLKPMVLASIAIDRADNLYFGSVDSNCVYELTPGGTPSIFASGVGGDPVALAINSAGDAFVSDNLTIVEIKPGGVQSTFASGFNNNPTALVFNSAGDLFASDILNTNLYEYTPGGAQSIIASNLSLPHAMAFDSLGNLFVCEAGGQGVSIIKIAPDGVQSTFATGPYGQVAIAFQPAPQLRTAMTNGTFQVMVSEPSPYFSTVLQASTDLVNWVNIYTNTPDYTFTNSMAPTSTRFYRAVLGP